MFKRLILDPPAIDAGISTICAKGGSSLVVCNIGPTIHSRTLLIPVEGSGALANSVQYLYQFK